MRRDLSPAGCEVMSCLRRTVYCDGFVPHAGLVAMVARTWQLSLAVKSRLLACMIRQQGSKLLGHETANHTTHALPLEVSQQATIDFITARSGMMVSMASQLTSVPIASLPRSRRCVQQRAARNSSVTTCRHASLNLVSCMTAPCLPRGLVLLYLPYESD